MITSERLRAPFLELAFYLGPGDHRLDVSVLLEDLLSQGVEFDSEILARDSGGNLVIVQCPFDSLAELPELEGGFAVRTRNFPGLLSGGEVLEYEGQHLLLRTEAGPLSVPEPKKSAREEAGLKVYRAFKCIANSLHAAYGAICIEYSLETPPELREDPRSLAFRNFWLGRSRIPDGLMLRVERQMSGAFVESWDGGIYFSTDAAYNPMRGGLDHADAVDRSVLVAKLLGRSLVA